MCMFVCLSSLSSLLRSSVPLSVHRRRALLGIRHVKCWIEKSFDFPLERRLYISSTLHLTSQYVDPCSVHHKYITAHDVTRAVARNDVVVVFLSTKTDGRPTAHIVCVSDNPAPLWLTTITRITRIYRSTGIVSSGAEDG